MKKIILFLLFLMPAYAIDYSSYCPLNTHSKTISGILMSTTGTNLLARQIAQSEIKKALKKETGSNFDVKINSFWGTNIAQGEFSKFSAVSKNYSDKHFQAEKLSVESICPYNKISYKDNKLNFDTDVILKYNAELNGANLSKIIKYPVQIINDKIVFDYKISVFGIKAKINLKAGLDIVDNKIQLCDIELNNKALKASNYLSILNNLDLTSFNINIDKTTNADVKVDNVKIKNSKVYVSGFVLIPQS